jgi:uncharacterized protein
MLSDCFCYRRILRFQKVSLSCRIRAVTVSVMESPCIQICVIDAHTKVCSGCHRTLAEIANWSRYSMGERQRIMASLPLRAGQDQQHRQLRKG